MERKRDGEKGDLSFSRSLILSFPLSFCSVSAFARRDSIMAYNPHAGDAYVQRTRSLDQQHQRRYQSQRRCQHRRRCGRA